MDALLKDREVAKRLGCGRSTLWRWVREGLFYKPLRIGGGSRWRESDVKAYFEHREAERLTGGYQPPPKD